MGIGLFATTGKEDWDRSRGAGVYWSVGNVFFLFVFFFRCRRLKKGEIPNDGTYVPVYQPYYYYVMSSCLPSISRRFSLVLVLLDLLSWTVEALLSMTRHRSRQASTTDRHLM